MASITRPTRDRRDPPMVNYKRGGNYIEHLRYSEDPNVVERSFFGDARFWFPHQADWYESVIMTKKHVTIEMKWIDWDYLKRLASPVKDVVNAVVDRCQEIDLIDIMSFTCHWNEEVVAQFYATLFIEESGRTFHWLLGGKRFTYNMAQFSILFGHIGDFTEYGGGYVVNRDNSKLDLHEGNELEPSKMQFMYDRAYGDIVYGSVKGLTPFYRLLNILFQFTLTPRGGDSDNISHRAKNLLAQMAPEKCKFAVMEFIWNEIIECSYDSSSACHYAPYIFDMIKTVTQLNILHSTIHSPYRTSKGKIEQALHIGNHNSEITPLGEFPGAYPSTFAPGASSFGATPSSPPAGPFTSRGHKASRAKKSKLTVIAQGVFACFNMCRQNAQEMCEHRKYMDEELLKLERRQKEIMAKVDLPHSPVREPRDFPTPPRVYNPWDDFVPQEDPLGDDVELDYDGQEV
jgi:hypothetical protein